MKHVTWRRLVLAVCLASIAVGGCNRKDAHRQASLQPPPQVVVDRCSQWRFDDPMQPKKQPKKPPKSGREECTPDQCGLNGMWFGQGVPFRELHLNGPPPPPGNIQLMEVIPPQPVKAGQIPKLAIRPALGHPKHGLSLHPPGPDLGDLGDELFIKDESTGETLFDGTDLKGTRLLIHLGSPLDDYVILKIEDVLERAFWDWDCDSKAISADCRVFHYEFTARTDEDESCDIQLCAPSLAQSQDSANGSMQGKAIVFAGDVYDGDSFKIKSVSADPKCSGDVLAQSEKDVINFACIGTVVSKLHLMRHTAASARPTKPTTVSQRQAMLRMLTADYCGTGHPFTDEGTPIRFQAMSWLGFQGYELKRGEDLEAVWTDRGAICIGTPRLATYDAIAAECPRPQCADRKPKTELLKPPPPPSSELTCSDASGNYLMSANPPR